MLNKKVKKAVKNILFFQNKIERIRREFANIQGYEANLEYWVDIFRFEIIEKCKDKFGDILRDGDYVDVQTSGIKRIYAKSDGQLYFKPYNKEEKVSSYFANDMIKCDKDGNDIHT